MVNTDLIRYVYRGSGYIGFSISNDEDIKWAFYNDKELDLAWEKISNTI